MHSKWCPTSIATFNYIPIISKYKENLIINYKKLMRIKL